MRPVLLRLDESLSMQPSFVERCAEMNACCVDARDLGPSVRLWARHKALAALSGRIGDFAEPSVVFAGSGDFHHVTPLLLTRAISAAGGPQTTIIHFDNHPDWVRYPNGLHCGSWAARAARHNNVSRIITIGVCSEDVVHKRNADLSVITDNRMEIYPFCQPKGAESLNLCGRAWPSLNALGLKEFKTLLQSRISTSAVYVTIDKDVLRNEEAVTNWDQGGMSLATLVDLIEAVTADRDLIGADIVGDWSRKAYGAGLSAVAKAGEAILDQPWRTPNLNSAAAINQSVNLELLNLFQRVRP